MTESERYYESLSLWTGRVTFFGGAMAAIFGIWTGDWRPAATIAIVSMLLFFVTLGASMLVKDEKRSRSSDHQS